MTSNQYNLVTAMYYVSFPTQIQTLTDISRSRTLLQKYRQTFC